MSVYTKQFPNTHNKDEHKGITCANEYSLVNLEFA